MEGIDIKTWQKMKKNKLKEHQRNYQAAKEININFFV